MYVNFYIGIFIEISNLLNKNGKYIHDKRTKSGSRSQKINDL